MSEVPLQVVRRQVHDFDKLKKASPLLVNNILRQREACLGPQFHVF